MKQPVFYALIIVMVAILLILIGFAVYGTLASPQTTSNTALPTTQLQFVTVTDIPTSTPTPMATRPKPSLSVLPVQGEASLLISVTGQNWPPNDTLLVQIDAPADGEGPVPLIEKARVTTDGAFLVSFTLAADSGWAQLSQVKITVESPTTGDLLATDFVTGGLYPPTLTPSPTQTTQPQPTATTTPTLPPTPLPTATPFTIATKLTPFSPQTAPQIALTPPATQYRPLPGEWLGEYYANPNLAGPPLLVRSEPTLNFDWGHSSPAPAIPVDGFSARWSRPTEFAPGHYRFTLSVAGSARLWANGQLLIDAWQDEGFREVVRDYIAGGGFSEITVTYANQQGEAKIRVGWEAVSPTPAPPQPTDSAALIAARTDLAQRTGVPLDHIRVLSITPMTWQNSNLACAAVQPGFQVIIPGFLIILEVDGLQYEYHTDAGSYVLLCALTPAASNQPGPPLPTPTGNASP